MINLVNPDNIMDGNINQNMSDVDMSTSEDISFDNLTILKEFSNIVNAVSDEDFLDTVPKAKLQRVKWVLMFNCLKQGILDGMIQEMNSMWEDENMPQKLEVLEKQKEKFAEIKTEGDLWRPQLGDVTSQLKAHDIAALMKHKKALEKLAQDYEVTVNKLKRTISAKRGYIKALQLDLQKYQKKNEIFNNTIIHKLANHDNHTKMLVPNKTSLDEKFCIDDEKTDTT